MRTQPNPRRVDTRGSRESVERGIWRRGNAWIVGYTDADGGWRTKTVAARNLTEARAARERLRVDVRSGASAVPTKATVADCAADFFDTLDGLVKAGEKSQRTLDLYRQRYRTHLKQPLGGIKVQALKAEHVSRVLAELRRQGKSSWTIKGVLTLLGVILNHAMSRGLLIESPLKRLSKTERPQARNKTKARRLGSEEIAALLTHAIPGYRPILATAALTGCRQSELLALRWSEIDFESGVIRVRSQLSRASKGNAARLLPLKTQAGERDIPIEPSLGKLLREHKARSRYSQERHFVFTTETGKPMAHRNVSRRGLETAADRAGLNEGDVPPLSMHDLRHSYISHLIRAGFDVVTVQRLAGHARPSITLDIYSGEFAERDRGADLAARIASTGLGSVLGASA